MVPLQVLSLRVRMDLEVMAVKGLLRDLKSLSLEPHH